MAIKTVIPISDKFEDYYASLARSLLRAPEVEVPYWQGLDVSDKPQGKTRERRNVLIEFPIPETQDELVRRIAPQMPWAEEQFQERVSGKPLNPPPSAARWLRPGTSDTHLTVEEDGVKKFSHSYPERFWPKHAGGSLQQDSGTDWDGVRLGIRFKYGDLNDLVALLAREPYTRQAYLPVFFPEDTGAHHGERIPCTLGYHFLLRNDQLHCTYFIRSCDLIRHFRDDVYMACRLVQWVCYQAFSSADIKPGDLCMHICSLHVFEGDLPKLRREYG